MVGIALAERDFFGRLLKSMTFSNSRWIDLSVCTSHESRYLSVGNCFIARLGVIHRLRFVLTSYYARFGYTINALVHREIDLQHSVLI